MLNPRAAGQQDKQDGAQGNWASDNRFSIGKCGTAAKLLTLPGLAVIRIFTYS